MKDYVLENQRILDEWKERFIENKKSEPDNSECDYIEYFAEDGIMNKGEFYINNDNECRRMPSGKENALWAEAPLKILFISKDQNAFGGVAKDVRSETFHKKGIDVPIINDYQIENSLFYQNEACLLYRLINSNIEIDRERILDFSWEEAVKFADEQIFARINCKKEIGDDRCSNALLLNAINEYSEYLKAQILNLDADILICCGYSIQIEKNHSCILNFLNTIGYNFKIVGGEPGGEVYYDSKNNKVALNVYHLSYFGYDYVQTILEYYKFLQHHSNFTKRK